MQPESKLNGTAQTPEEHARACWSALTTHCHANRCNCHLGIYGSVHIISGCETGRMLADEYDIATKRVRDMLEAGDMGSTLDYPSQDELDAADRSMVLPL